MPAGDNNQQFLADTFKTTSIKELNEKKQKQLGWDDSSFSSSSNSTLSSMSSRFKSHTVKYKPVKKRSTFLNSHHEGIDDTDCKTTQSDQEVA